MDLMDFLLYIFASIGLTWLIVDSTIVAPVKNWISECSWLPTWFKNKFAQLTSCYQCTGFWSGIIVSALMEYPLIYILLCGFASSWLSPLGYLMVSYLNVAASSFSIDDEDEDDYEEEEYEEDLE